MTAQYAQIACECCGIQKDPTEYPDDISIGGTEDVFCNACLAVSKEDKKEVSDTMLQAMGEPCQDEYKYYLQDLHAPEKEVSKEIYYATVRDPYTSKTGRIELIDNTPHKSNEEIALDLISKWGTQSYVNNCQRTAALQCMIVEQLDLKDTFIPATSADYHATIGAK